MALRGPLSIREGGGVSILAALRERSPQEVKRRKCGNMGNTKEKMGWRRKLKKKRGKSRKKTCIEAAINDDDVLMTEAMVSLAPTPCGVEFPKYTGKGL